MNLIFVYIYNDNTQTFGGMMKRLILAFLLLSSLSAGEITENMQKVINFHVKKIEAMAANPVLIDTVKAINLESKSMEDILTIDKNWQAGGENELAKNLGENKGGVYLRRTVSESILYTEAFATGKQGELAAVFPKTSDFYQGDEDKFIECYKDGAGEVFIGELEEDISTKTISVQISVPILDGDNTIGVLIVGIKNLE
jgi:hypothetical protein